MNQFSYSKVLISGGGFLADAYDLFVINIAVDLMDKCDYQQELTEELKSTIKSMALAGAIVGQIFFGSIADLIGRKRVFLVTCLLVLFGAILSSTVVDGDYIFTQLIIWRFVLGVGVGGEYPLSASVTSESSSAENEIKNLALVFSMQGVGTLLCSIILVMITQSMGNENYDAQWRIALAFGGLPMACAFYFRWKMHETSWKEEAAELHKIRNQNHEVSLQQNQTSLTTFISEGLENVWENVKENSNKLLGTAGAWFILDIVFYANGLFSGQVTNAMGISSSPKGEAVASLILQSIALPGYFFSIIFAETIGLKKLQLYGFISTAGFFFLLAAFQPYLSEVPALYVILYGFTFFFQNFGANATTYIIPSIIYTSAERGTCHGISSAAGKLGALLGAQTFLYLTGSFCKEGCTDDSPTDEINSGLQITFAVCGLLSITGWLWTYFLVTDIPARSLIKDLPVSVELSSQSSETINAIIQSFGPKADI